MKMPSDRLHLGLRGQDQDPSRSHRHPTSGQAAEQRPVGAAVLVMEQSGHLSWLAPSKLPGQVFGAPALLASLGRVAIFVPQETALACEHWWQTLRCQWTPPLSTPLQGLQSHSLAPHLQHWHLQAPCQR